MLTTGVESFFLCWIWSFRKKKKKPAGRKLKQSRQSIHVERDGFLGERDTCASEVIPGRLDLRRIFSNLKLSAPCKFNVLFWVYSAQITLKDKMTTSGTFPWPFFVIVFRLSHVGKKKLPNLSTKYHNSQQSFNCSSGVSHLA